MRSLSNFCLAILAAISLSACVSSNLTQLTEALAKDPATACMSVGTPYGTISVARSNPNNQAVKISATGGGCTVEHTFPVPPPTIITTTGSAGLLRQSPLSGGN